MKTRFVQIDIDRLESDLAEAQSDLRDAQSRIARLNGVLEYVREEDGDVLGTGSSNGRTSLLDVAGAGTVHAACEVVLREHGLPMQTAQIVDVLRSSGYGSHLSSLHNSVFTAMDRHTDIFDKIGRGVWGLRHTNDMEEESEDSPEE